MTKNLLDLCVTCEKEFLYDKVDMIDMNYDICRYCERKYCKVCQDKYDLFDYTLLTGSMCFICIKTKK
jgi:hypothetical protein